MTILKIHRICDQQGSMSIVLLVTVAGIALIYSLTSFLHHSSDQINFRTNVHRTSNEAFLIQREFLIYLSSPSECSKVFKGHQITTSPTELSRNSVQSLSHFLETRQVSKMTLESINTNTIKVVAYRDHSSEKDLSFNISVKTNQDIITNCSSDSTQMAGQ